jgi:hypothetical protein
MTRDDDQHHHRRHDADHGGLLRDVVQVLRATGKRRPTVREMRRPCRPAARPSAAAAGRGRHAAMYARSAMRAWPTHRRARLPAGQGRSATAPWRSRAPRCCSEAARPAFIARATYMRQAPCRR